MLTIGRNNIEKWELLLRVLSEENKETDPLFQAWLLEDEKNAELFQLLKKGILDKEDCMPDKDEMYKKIATTLSFNRKKSSLYKKVWFNYSASIFLFSLLSIVAYFIFEVKNLDEQTVTLNKNKNISNAGTEYIYLISSQGDTIDLSKTFEIEKKDGTVISNNAEGIISVEKKKDEIASFVENHTICVPRGRVYTLLLADGSTVHLNSETQLTFPSSFSNDQRLVTLIGEAYFEVNKNNKPFIVQTEDLQIKVLGTSFNVNAYQDNPYTRATLVEGNVEIYTDHAIQPRALVPGENLDFDKTTHQISINQVNTELYTAWINGIFTFRNQTLSEIFGQLKRWYNFEIVYDDTSIQFMRFTGSAEKVRPLVYLLDQIESVTDVKYIIYNDKIVLY